MPIALIAAMDKNRTIGVRNELPWRLPAEMAHFIKTTTGKTVLMGRKTFDSLGGKSLPRRKNIVLTRQTDAVMEGCEVVHSIEEAVKRYGSDDLIVIGGAEIYGLLLPYADTLFLTDVDTVVEGGDAFFPPFSLDEWKLVGSDHRAADEKNRFSFTINTYKRTNG